MRRDSFRRRNWARQHESHPIAIESRNYESAICRRRFSETTQRPEKLGAQWILAGVSVNKERGTAHMRACGGELPAWLPRIPIRGIQACLL
jgi:hypothetical protein